MIALDVSFNSWCSYCGKRLHLHTHGYQSALRVKEPMHYVYCTGCQTETKRGVVCTVEQALASHRELCRQRKEAERGS